MPKNKTNSNVKREPSQVAQFVARDLPTDNQSKRFDRYLKKGLDEGTIDESLSEIYQDDGGKRINVKQVDIQPKKGFFVRLGIILIYVLIVAAITAGAYYWFISRNADSTSVDLKISAPEKLIANQEFEYVIDYQNKDKVALGNLELAVVYPDNFIFESSFPTASNDNNKWSLEDLRQFSSGQVKIKGRLISPTGSSNVMFADLTYKPINISSEFKKSTSLDTVLAGSGLDLSAVVPTSIMVGQDSELLVKFKTTDTNFLDHFNIRFPALDNLSFPTADYGKDVTVVSPGVYAISNLTNTDQELRIKFKFTDKKNDTEDFKVNFEYQPTGSEKAYSFDEKSFTVEVVKNSLNLTVVANGQPSDQGIDFGQTINYSISYVNKGEKVMDDVIIMAVLDGEALDWRKLLDKNDGSVTGRTITWTKDQIPELKSLAKDQTGSIDFSIPVRDVSEAGLIRTYEIKSYAQFAVSGKAEELSQTNEVNRSNQLTIKLNSDTKLDEAVRYFDQDNIAVGTGPLPPQVGQTSTFKIYWNLSNSLHELGDIKIKTKLPDYVAWDGKDQADVGTLSYNQDTNEVTWDIGRLPLSAAHTQGQFSISIKPRATDRNKLLVLVSGTTLTGTDNTTSFPISQILKAQTTKLEKDDIAETDGIVQ
ncbi:MAG: hypothetical protein NTY12_02955 [Candidatus Falkowbacteria bacterium]|nr:hypothetical protein [Candidatus Falkowbacteria bacterium]